MARRVSNRDSRGVRGRGEMARRVPTRGAPRVARHGGAARRVSVRADRATGVACGCCCFSARVIPAPISDARESAGAAVRRVCASRFAPRGAFRGHEKVDSAASDTWAPSGNFYSGPLPSLWGKVAQVSVFIAPRERSRGPIRKSRRDRSLEPAAVSRRVLFFKNLNTGVLHNGGITATEEVSNLNSNESRDNPNLRT